MMDGENFSFMSRTTTFHGIGLYNCPTQKTNMSPFLSITNSVNKRQGLNPRRGGV